MVSEAWQVISGDIGRNTVLNRVDCVIHGVITVGGTPKLYALPIIRAKLVKKGGFWMKKGGFYTGKFLKNKKPNANDGRYSSVLLCPFSGLGGVSPIPN